MSHKCDLCRGLDAMPRLDGYWLCDSCVIGHRDEQPLRPAEIVVAVVLGALLVLCLVADGLL